MLKIEFTNAEIENIYSKITFTPLQKRIIEYRRLEYSIVKISQLEYCSTSKIDKEISKINKKIMKVI